MGGDKHEAVRQQLLQQLFGNLFLSLLWSLLLAGAVALPLWAPDRADEIVLWLVVMLVATLLRLPLLVAWRWRRQGERQDSRRWLPWLRLGAACSGLAWGGLAWLLMPVIGLPGQIYITFVLIGTAAGSVLTLGGDRASAWSYVVPCIVPLSAQWLINRAGNDMPVLFILIAVYLMMVSTLINRIYAQLSEGIALRLAAEERTAIREQSATALRASHQRLKDISDSVPGIIYEYRMGADGSVGCTYVSEKIRDLYELTPEQLYENPDSLLTRVDPEDSARVLASVQDCALTLEPWGIDFRVCLPQRGRRWMRGEAVGKTQPDGSVMWYGYVADITERKQAEQEFALLHNRLELATHAGGIGVWETDFVTQELRWDDRIYEIYGVPLGTKMSLTTDFVHPDDVEMVVQVFRDISADPSTNNYQVEHRILTMDGMHERYIKSAGHVYRTESGGIARILGVTWDVTDGKKVDRMKSDFIATVSHELRTPMTSIRGSLGLLTGGVAGELPQQASELIKIAYKNSERLAVLINDILDIEKIEAGKMRFEIKPHNLAQLLAEAVEINRSYAQTYAVELLLAPLPAALEVAIDGNRVMQVMANLLSNAAKFSPAGGVVDIVALVADGTVRVEVRDRGPGISAEFAPYIFQKFSQADTSDARAKGGTGLGLVICKAIIERMRGQIGFEPREGGGTLFFFALPLLQASSADA